MVYFCPCLSVAVELSNINAKLNHIENVKAYLSDAFLSVDKNLYFDQIISNKFNTRVFYSFIA
jgi:16S rRNA G1207 methylase RsmC